jgi:hypothetical protein
VCFWAYGADKMFNQELFYRHRYKNRWHACSCPSETAAPLSQITDIAPAVYTLTAQISH